MPSQTSSRAWMSFDVLRAGDEIGRRANGEVVRAPFDGRISIRQVELGQVVAPGTPIASLQSVSPIHVDFWVPQQALSELRAGLEARIRTDAFPGAEWKGEITTVNPEVDVATRNVRVRATFANQDGRLRPGMFANVQVLSKDLNEVFRLGNGFHPVVMSYRHTTAFFRYHQHHPSLTSS